VVAVYWDIAAGIGWLLGLAWSVVNLYLIGLIVQTMLSRGPIRKLRIALVMIVKLPVLYAVGFVLLSSAWFPIASLLAGFIWPLVVIVLKVLGRAILRMDEPRRVLELDVDQMAKRIQR
jgi:hypothetical protein